MGNNDAGEMLEACKEENLRLEKQLEDKARYRVESPEHALVCGMVMGAAMKYGVPMEPEYDEFGNYLASFVLTPPAGLLAEPNVTIRLVVEAPPSKLPYVDPIPEYSRHFDLPSPTEP